MNPLDTTRAHETPEGVELELRLAGPVVRACAWAIDAAIRAALYLVIGYAFSLFGGLGLSLMLIAFFLLEWFYPVFFEVSNGQTPGKRAMGIHVVHDNGTPVGWPAALLRNLLRAVDFLPLLYSVGLLTMLINTEFRRLGDLAAGTLVTYRDRAGEEPRLPAATAVRPAAGLDVDEQFLLLLFAERSPSLSTARRAELADVLQGLTGRRGEEGVRVLWGYAHWLVEGR
jgi:uncharacterized RDD family membrane protein YckC